MPDPANKIRIEVVDAPLEQVQSETIPVNLRIPLQEKPVVLKKSGRNSVHRHLLEDQIFGKISIIEKRYFSARYSTGFKIYRDLRTRSGDIWRIPQIHCLRAGHDFHSIFMEDTAFSGCLPIKRTERNMPGIASAIGEMNADLSDHGDIVSAIAKDRKPPGLLDLSNVKPFVFKDFFDQKLADKARQVRSGLIEAMHENDRITAALSFSLAHGDLNRSNINWDPAGEKYVFFDWDTASMLPCGGDLSQFLYSTWWGYLASGRYMRAKSVDDITRIEAPVISAYRRALGRNDVDEEACLVGLSITLARVQFLNRLPHALKVMKAPEKEADHENMAIFCEKLNYMVERMVWLTRKLRTL